ncbi:VOC family protein [Mycobacterium persicum]|uniref:Glyoxalase n=1 Tax=Mycobacterium persicum TaxID=1487726 RepID=A0A1X0LEX2_9MYCO|nr:VOC family protein [Mycobacterium persicum]KZS77831.1 glyoxalase [Mycobacterium persicum]ORB36279.1 glyoxalase [Mycobacterium persicum]ORB91834.1 glyoxalase [Mycobacterium persicum]ORB97199.1 glyoxalase [Mycobacterium persicum]ORC03873.1 glyoxalase [Mycobacterium persicum]
MTELRTFLWNELLTDDQLTAGEFYSQLFGWQRREVDAGPLGTYTVFQCDGRDVAGMMNPTARDYAGSPPPRWIAYIAVDNAAKIAARVADLGGTVLEPPHHVSGVGTICMFKDPVGAVIYMMEPDRTPAE